MHTPITHTQVTCVGDNNDMMFDMIDQSPHTYQPYGTVYGCVRTHARVVHRFARTVARARQRRTQVSRQQRPVRIVSPPPVRRHTQ
jgi:hypothetical protein